ncbi:MAG: GGDEF domain-containing protein [Actinobacteria bacterium]|nr:GGDEF domain-containing protein [Actinomycetota bacterium]
MDGEALLRAVIETQAAINDADPSLEGVMQLVARRAEELTNADAAIVELAEGDEMVYAAATGTAADHVGLRLSLHTSLSGLSVRTGKLQTCEDSETDPRVDKQACRAVGVRSMIVVPLIHRGAALGVLKVMSGSAHHFDHSDQLILEPLAGFIAAALRKARDYERTMHEATHDTLTGLANRALLLQNLRTSLARIERNGSRVTVYFIDLDGFKPINDTYGHEIGDTTLVTVAQRIRQAVRVTDTCARVGGDEFVVLAETAADSDEPGLLQRIREAVEEPVESAMGEVRVGASIGVASALADELPESLLARADAAMYSQKRTRKGEVPGRAA